MQKHYLLGGGWFNNAVNCLIAYYDEVPSAGYGGVSFRIIKVI